MFVSITLQIVALAPPVVRLSAFLGDFPSPLHIKRLQLEAARK